MTALPGSGEAFGPYRVDELLGSGTTGAVFEAFDFRLSRAVALKIIAPGLASTPGFAERFAVGATALTGLDQLHVVQTYEHGEQNGSHYLVTQLVKDGDFAGHVRRSGPLATKTALSVVGQVCEALAYAAGRGVVHGSIKPTNVLVRDRGSVLYAYLCDFGIAGSTFGGDLGYVAPEVRAGSVADQRSDLYAVGAVLWFALTGTAPAAGQVPQVAAEDAGSERLNEVLRRTLAADPADRYAGAEELGQAVAGVGLVPTYVRIAPALVEHVGTPVPEETVEPEAEPSVPIADYNDLFADVPAVTPEPALVEPVETPAPALVEPVETPEPALVEPVETPEPEPHVSDEIPEQLLGWRARRALKRTRAEQSAPAPDPEPALVEPVETPAPEPEPALVELVETPEPEVEVAPTSEPRAKRARRKEKPAKPAKAEKPAKPAKPPRAKRERVKTDRPRRDLSWMLPGGMLLVLPVIALVVVFVLVLGKGGNNYGSSVTTPPQVIQQGQTFSFGAFTADPEWKVATAGPLWQVENLFVVNVSSQPEDARFTLKFKKAGTVLVALDCRTAELLPAQRQAVSCDDASNAAYDPGWDQVTVEQAY